MRIYFIQLLYLFVQRGCLPNVFTPECCMWCPRIRVLPAARYSTKKSRLLNFPPRSDILGMHQVNYNAKCSHKKRDQKRIHLRDYSYIKHTQSVPRR